ALNSYKNGVIGGNVIFADSYGFIVGASGVVNVGSLSVVTPTQKTIDQLIGPDGVVNNALASQLIHGNVPISSDGSVAISGQVIAQHGVRINAHDVLVAGSIPEAERVARQRAQFESTVNARGMTEGGAIVVRNGAISIVATNNAGIDGRLSAGGSTRHGGSVSIAAANNVTIGAGAKISARAAKAGAASAANATAPASTVAQITVAAGNDATIAGSLAATSAASGAPAQIEVTGEDISVAATAKLAAVGVGAVDGGHISIKSTDTTTVAAGASFAANALGTGNGGLIEISG
ncbi:leukotoxin LktA family filamentous adhesin, partial [Methylocapsa sp. S129]|uniref:leukotoxin LktA family filamentous adhesin n=1 Tax=Methylocapsa sp. S129 TaxID=1641869 RepID=UPI001AEEDCC5